MLTKLINKLADPRIVICEGSRERLKRTCPECGVVASGRTGWNYYGFFGLEYDFYSCSKCQTRWRVRQK